MPLSAPSKRDTDGRCSRDRATADPDAAERLRSVRERLEAAVSGLGELEYLRQRQEELVRAALELRETPDEEEEERSEALSSEEKLLEENILLLRKQLTCLRRRDAGLMSQLQELDRQISDLRLDTEESHDHLEMDSRPSSGFYELSDGASGSLSNSSNSVFSECFCSTVDAEGRLPPTDDSSCLECDGLVGGLHDDPSSGPVRRSFSAPHPPALDPVPLAISMDSLSKYHCDLVARKGSDVYRYPSPLHAVAVQSPSFLQMLSHGSHSRDEAVLKVSAEPDSPLVPQSSSWPVTSSSSSSSSSSQTPCHKRLDSYIFSLLQRRVLPIRTSRPRTSISTDPSKSILRQASLCVRQLSDALGDWPAGGNQSGGSGPWPGQPTNPTWPGQPPANPTWPGGPSAGGGGVWPGGNPTQPAQPTWPSPSGQPGAWPSPSPGPGPGPIHPTAPSRVVPYEQNLPSGVYDKLLITIAGTVKPNADKITVDLSTGNDIAFHFNPRFNDDGRKAIVRNSCIGKKWGKEERELQHFPLVRGQPFEMKILCTSREFKVAINNSHLLEFRHRITDLRSITRLNIYYDLNLSKVLLETTS
ncbi:hypothetical protein INR49_031434 [Caranx melampygus]|nr:hypothetical protein INR49_031434 [Caranx melampygus]